MPNRPAAHAITAAGPGVPKLFLARHETYHVPGGKADISSTAALRDQVLMAASAKFILLLSLLLEAPNDEVP